VATVIIPAYNAAPTIAPCLQALREQTVPWESLEVIVVDDGSTDETAAVAEEAGARVVRMVHAGPAAARNAGAGAAHSSLLLFTDADCAPGPRWVESLLQALADAGTAGAKGTYRTEQRGLVPRFVQQEYEDRYARLERQETIDFVDTYAAAYRRDVFLANEGFDPVFPVPSVEDQELSFRLARKGYCLRFAPAAWVWHQHDADLAEYVRRKFGIGYWKALLLHRHPERAVHDSHTPPVLRAQIGLMALLLLSLPLLLPWPALWPLPAAVAAALLLSAVPFTLRCARRDPPVALLAPLLLGARALALGCGLLAGLLRFALYPLPAPAGTRPVARLLKRSLDLLGATLGLVLAGPVILLLGLLVRLDSSGPAFFVQERVGQNGRVFGMFKLRSMVHGSEAPAAEVDPAAMDPPIPKPAEDPRVTRLGRFLRRWSLDELPQFFNVLKGEMSLVGPRPEEVRIVRRYADWHRRLLLARPGMTGPMQINGRGDLSLDRRVELELAYIDHYSLWRDLGILARTIPAVVSGKGAR
jgi:lipopolysaccharide/colanic/teichoic acid biosynthesis glycosyltransferase/GT2 family glycosyltransferase